WRSRHCTTHEFRGCSDDFGRVSGTDSGAPFEADLDPGSCVQGVADSEAMARGTGACTTTSQSTDPTVDSATIPGGSVSPVRSGDVAAAIGDGDRQTASSISDSTAQVSVGCSRLSALNSDRKVTRRAAAEKRKLKSSGKA
ncbi:hypothetical protein BVRB_030850, partial [Beta vulgaris subsp. vulgaris]